MPSTLPCDSALKRGQTTWSMTFNKLLGHESLIYTSINQKWFYIYMNMLSRFSRVQLFATLCTVAHQAPLSRGFSRQEYWSRLLFPSPGDLPNQEIKPMSLMSPALAGRFFNTSSTWDAPLSLSNFIYSPWPAGELGLIRIPIQQGRRLEPTTNLSQHLNRRGSSVKSSSKAHLHFAQVIPLAVHTGLLTSLLFLLAACHLALSLLISTSTAVQQGKSRRVSLGGQQLNCVV